jgi:histidinol phosphatase-like PHP family hydrolase
VTNRQLAELLALEADKFGPPLNRAMRRASRLSLSWPVEVAWLWAQGESIQSLPGVGPVLGKQITRWLEEPPAPVEELPPLRADFLSLAAARQVLQALPDWRSRGDLQMHSTWSDGSDEIEDLADAARERDYDYIAITDHTKGLKIAGGIDEQQLLQQAEEIQRLNQRSQRLQILRSAEVNLSPRGEVDIEGAALDALDIVLGCFHSKLRLKEDQTERYLAAIRNPHIHILGHPRGRMYNFRLGLQADWRQVFDEAARLDKAVEIDCYPDRQDLDLKTLEQARAADVRISLGTDAHARHQLHFIDLGLAAAWLAGIRRERILNFMSCQELLAWTAELRERGKRSRP